MKYLMFIGLLLHVNVYAQNKLVVSGPMLGQVEMRTATVWLEVSSDVKKVALQYWRKDGALKSVRTKIFKGELGNEFNPVKMDMGDLEMNTTYYYQFVLDGTGQPKTVGSFTTKDLWQFRKSAPDFSFLTGSCSYFNEPIYDRPGKPYGGDSSIFETMAKTPAAFMMWLGDNWYTREADYYSEWGLWYRASLTRRLPILQNFWKAMGHFAIWDDHDYGPNDSDKSYVLKDKSKNVFTNYWCNPSVGIDNEGITTKVSYHDVEFFMLDDRWWRSNDEMEDSIAGQPNPAKRMYGPKQMEWLKNALLQSKTNPNVTFRVIVTGSQVLNPMSPYDCFNHFSFEYNEMMQFLDEAKIPGLLFLTGDRHHTEVIKKERANAYPLYDVTVSPLTSSTHKFGGPEKQNPYRVIGIDQLQNFAKVSVTGSKNNRKMTFDFLGIKGDPIGEWTVTEKELAYK